VLALPSGDSTLMFYIFYKKGGLKLKSFEVNTFTFELTGIIEDTAMQDLEAVNLKPLYFKTD
jgi:hypothetical protein